MVLRDGVLLGMLPGVMRAEAIDELVGKVKALDMDEVQRAAEPTAKVANAGGV
jgi:thioredoxin 1